MHFLHVSIVSGVDINECERSEHNCSQLCDNVPGGFACGCEAGYSLQEDVVTCTGMLSCQTLSLCVCVCVSYLLTMLSLRDCEYSEEQLMSFEIWSFTVAVF